MKFLLQLLGIGLLLILVSDQLPSYQIKKLSKAQRIDLAYQLEFEKTHDLKTNTIPSERLAKARMVAKQKRQEKSIATIAWEERGPDNVGGRTRAILYDLNDANRRVVFAGSVGGGLWRTDNINASTPNWKPIDDFWSNIAISSIVQSKTNPNLIYVGTGEGWFNGDAIRGNGIWKSTDGGQSFNRLAGTQQFNYINKIVLGANNVVFVAVRNNNRATGGIYRSEDDGISWQRVLTSLPSIGRGADIEVAANGDLYASMGIFYSDGIYKSTDNGLNWMKVYDSSNNEARIELACAPSNPQVVYALFHNMSEDEIPAIRKTTDGGQTWEEMSTPLWYDQNCAQLSEDWTRGQAWYDLTAAVDPNNHNVLFVGGVDLFKTTDGGVTWNQISHWYTNSRCDYPSERVVHADQHAIVFRPEKSNEILFGHDGGISQTTNANTFDAENITFRSKSGNYNVTQFYATAISNEEGSNRFIAGAQDNGTQYYRTDGINSTRQVTGGDGAFCHIDEDSPAIQISSYVYNSYYITKNSWGNVSYTGLEDGGRFINPTDYDSEENILYGAFDESSYAYVKDVGRFNVAGTQNLEELDGTISAVLVSPNTKNRVFFGTGSGSVLRVDSAHTDQPIAQLMNQNLPNGYISSIAVEKNNDNHLLLCFTNYGINSIWETINGGTTWQSVEGDLPDMPVRWVEFNPNNPNQAVIATELGVWTTDNLNRNNTIWKPSNNGLANVRTDMLQFRTSDNILIAATHGRGLFSTNSFKAQIKPNLSCGGVLGVDIEDQILQINNLNIENTNNFALENNFEVAYYLSKNQFITTEDILIKTDTVQALEANEDYTTNFTIDLSILNIPNGLYHFGYIIDSNNAINETNEEDNNCLQENSSIQIGESPCENVAIINCGDRIEGNNLGQADNFNVSSYSCLGFGPPFTAADRIYQVELPLNSNIEIRLTGLTDDLDIFLLDTCTQSANCLASSLNLEEEEELIAVSGLSGTYYIVVDGYLPTIESAYTLSVSCEEIQFPNLFCSELGNLEVTETSFNLNNFEISNNGFLSATNSQLSFVLSEDEIIDAYDYVLRTFDVPELATNTSFQLDNYSAALNTLEAPNGEYFLGVLLDSDNRLTEVNELDNSCYWESPKITVENLSDDPNLICDDLGQLSFNNSYLSILNLSVLNIGVDKAGSSYIGYYLSVDQEITVEDIYLGESFVRPLNSGTRSVEFFNTRLSTIPSGSYYVGLILDYKESVQESTRRDNIYVYEEQFVKTTRPNLETATIPLKSNFDFSISPNPNSGQFVLQLEEEIIPSNSTVALFSVNGKMLLEQVLLEHKHTLDISAFAEGIYYVRLTNGKQTKVEKVMVVR